MFRGLDVIYGAGSMAVQLRLRPVPALLGFGQSLRGGPLLNCRHRESDTADRPVAYQAGHQRQ